MSLELNYDFGGTTLTSISAYREFDSFDQIDADFSNVDILTDTNRAEQNSVSQELRLTGGLGDRTTYVAGVYYFSQDLDNSSTLDLGAATSAFLSADPLLSQVISSINLFSPPFPPVADPFPSTAFARDVMLQQHENWAVFAQADFELSDEFILTAGLRYTDEEKELRGTFENSPLGPPPDFTQIVTVLTLIQMGLARSDRSGQRTDITGRVRTNLYAGLGHVHAAGAGAAGPAGRKSRRRPADRYRQAVVVRERHNIVLRIFRHRLQVGRHEYRSHQSDFLADVRV
ncbi:MAG: TonB-dependent receptor [Woeseiaceae bacterium]|nr:TonB-dependent receptor [Woeseiaceae bacterium]